VLDLLIKLRKDIGIILVTHRFNIARHSDRIYILENGSIIAGGSHTELLTTENFYSQSFNDYLITNGKVHNN
ncbi:MAG TPA: hypothetical protein PLK12_06755, partial [Prolixibacteraceae bacterium]|nr:hypothetical protein [Prolixibacteraceae bacterium]